MHLRGIGNGLPVQIELSPGQMNDQPMAELLLKDLPAGADVIADKGYDADWIRDLIEDQECTPHIPPKSNRYDGITYSKTKYKKRNLIERCFNKLKQFRHIATRYDRNALNYLAMIKIAVVRLWLRFMSPQPSAAAIQRINAISVSIARFPNYREVLSTNSASDHTRNNLAIEHPGAT